ncbi:eukaryotic translation initiation factor 5A-1-like, partial [Oncorhynchus nerka]|uniref:eukaryotic translation initiation factor 5A-1-like n=1 Tax=Oncorhynchus nerka TaxID=8023 RepID=UPI0031B893AA
YLECAFVCPTVDVTWCLCFQLLNITDGFMSLMGDNGDVREDLRVPDSDLGKEIEQKFAASEDIHQSYLSAGLCAVCYGGGVCCGH